MRGGGYGLIGDIVVGLIGAFIGGWLAGFLGLGGSSSLIVTIMIAFIGACILLAILHAVTREDHPGGDSGDGSGSGGEVRAGGVDGVYPHDALIDTDDFLNGDVAI